MDFSSLLKILNPDEEANATPIPSDNVAVPDPTADLPPLATQSGAQTGLMSSDSPTPSLSMTAEVPKSMIQSDSDESSDTDSSGSGRDGVVPESAPQSDVASFIAKKYGFSPLMDNQALQNAQNSSNQQQLMANLGQAFDKIGSSIARTKESPEAQAFYQNLQEQAKNPVKDLIQQRAAAQQQQAFAQEQENEDPNSVKAAITRKFYAPQMQKVGLDPNSLKGLSANDQKNFAEKELDFAAKQKQQEEQASENRAMRETISGNLAANRKDAADAKQDEKKDKAYTDLRHNLETFRGNQAAQQAALGIQNANRALAIVKGKDPNTLTTQDLSLLAEEMGKVATGGVPTEGGVKALMPNNLQTKLAEMKNFLLSKPTDANAAEYIKHNMNYLDDMKNVSQDALNAYRTNIAKGFKNRVRPEDYAEALNDYPGTDGSKMPAPTPVSNSGPGIDQSGLEAEMRKRGLLK